MAPRLDPIVVERIEEALRDPYAPITYSYFEQLANTFNCSFQTIYRHHKRIQIGLPPGRRSGGPRRIITFRIKVAIKHLLDLMPWYYQDEIRDFLHDAFDITVTRQAISKALKRIKYTRKRLKVIAAQRNDELRTD